MTMLGTTDVGIAAVNCRGLVLANSCIRGWTDLGVSLRNVQSPRLYYNSIVGPDSGGNVVVDLANVAGAEARDNIFWNRGRYGSTCYDISEAFPFAPGASDYNDLCTSDSGSVARVNETAFARLADWRAHPATPDLHSLSRDPLFLPGDDYHLSSASPCRDSGIPIAGLSYDIELDERDTLSPDIGADEFTPGAVSEGARLHQLRSMLRVSPNPCRSATVLHLTTGPLDHSPTFLRICDASGRVVLSRPDLTSPFVVSTLSFPSGVYLVRVAAAGLVAAQKLVVRR